MGKGMQYIEMENKKRKPQFKIKGICRIKQCDLLKILKNWD